MTPTVDERLASIVRSLTEVVLPHLPPDASLAQEQVHLAIGHLQILRDQIDLLPEFERKELEDARGIAAALAELSGGAKTSAALATLAQSVALADGSHVRSQTTEINKAIDAVVKAIAVDGTAESRPRMSQIILEHEKARVLKDRHWFLPFGFDTIVEVA